MSDQVKYVLLLSDAFTSTFDKFKSKGDSAFNKLNSSVTGLQSKLNTLNTGKASHSIDQLNSKLDELRKTRNLSVDLKHIKNLNKEIESTEKQLRKLETRGTKSSSGGGMLGNVGGELLGGLGVGLGVGAAVAGGVELTKKIVEVRGEREKMEAVLTTSYMGNKDKAKVAMNDIANFAAKTPFQVTELTDSFVKLTNQGMNPNMTTFKSMGDLAASVGKDFGQLTEAILDARMGEFERLKEFGVKAKVHGDKVTMSFKGQTTEIKNTGKAIEDYLLGLGKMDGVTGSMESISKTLTGSISNMSDSWDNLMNTMGSGTGVFSSTIGLMQQLIDKTNEWVKTDQQRKDEGGLKQSSSYTNLAAQYKKEGKTKEEATTLLTNKLLADTDAQRGKVAFFEKNIKNASLQDNLVNNLLFGFSGFHTSDYNADTQLKLEEEGKLGKLQSLKKTGVSSYINDIYKSESKDEKKGTSSGIGANTESVVSDARTAKNINISIGKMVEKFEVHSSSVTEGAEDIKAKITEVFLTAVNDANYATK